MRPTTGYLFLNMTLKHGTMISSCPHLSHLGSSLLSPHQSYRRMSGTIFRAMTKTPSLESSGLPKPCTHIFTSALHPDASLTPASSCPSVQTSHLLHMTDATLSPTLPICECSYFKREHAGDLGCSSVTEHLPAGTSPWGGGRGDLEEGRREEKRKGREGKGSFVTVQV